MTNVLKIGNLDFTPYLTGMTVTIQDIEAEATRTTNGNLKRNRIAVKRNIDLTFKPLTQTESQTILTAITDLFFNVTYIDPQLGTTTKTFYVSDRNAPFLAIDNGMWNGLAFTFSEQ